MPGAPVYDIPGRFKYQSPVLTSGFIYAALVTAGGVMGYVKKGSVPSLVAGAGSGILAGWGAYVGR